MKRVLCAFLMVVFIALALPWSALAAVGHILTAEELAAAYALTGYTDGEEGPRANGFSYHRGMKPNATWNASQLSDYLEEVLTLNLSNIESILSRAAYTLAEMKEVAPDAYDKFMDSNGKRMERAQEIYMEAEQLRQEIRYQKDRIEQDANVIASLGARLTEEGETMFDSDRVRYSAKIEAATKSLTEARAYVAQNTGEWEEMLDEWQMKLQQGPAGPEDEGSGFIGDLITDLELGVGNPDVNTASVASVSNSGSRMGRMASGQSVLSNDSDATVTVISKNQICVKLIADINGAPQGVEDVKVYVQDALSDLEGVEVFTSNANGLVMLPTNLFTTDELETVHVYLSVDPQDQGYRRFTIDDLQLQLGEMYTAVLKPLKDESGNEEPYIVSASFNGQDIMNAKYEMLYSELNNYDFTIEVEAVNPSNKPLPDLYMTYYRNPLRSSSESDKGIVDSFKLEKVTVRASSRDGRTYTFRGPWKQLFSPSATSRQRPSFSFGTDANAFVYSTQLVSVKGVTGKPINEGTGLSGGIFGNVLGKGLDIGFTIPVIDTNISFSLPLAEYVPKLSIDPMGFVTIYLGAPAFEDAVKKSKANWQNKDVEKFKQAQKWVEQEGMLANAKAQYNLARDYYKTKTLKFLAESKLSLGWFVVATGRWELDKSVADVLSRNVDIRVATGFTLNYVFSWTISYPLGPVPVYICFSLAVRSGFALEMKLSFCWVNGEFRDWKLTPINNLTINISFSFGAQLGVGIKGFLDVWVKFSASLNVKIAVSIMGSDLSYMQVNYGLSLIIGATLFFVTLDKTFPVKSGTLWDSRNSAANPLQAYAANGNTKQQEAAHSEPLSYPKLRTKPEWVIGSASLPIYTSFKLLNVGGHRYAFYIVDDIRGRRHVGWRNLDESMVTGNVVSALKDTEVYNMKDYAFDVYESDGIVFLVALCAESFDSDGLPTPGVGNAHYYTMMLQEVNGRNLSANLAASDETGNHFFRSVGVVRVGTQDDGYRYSYDSAADPHISFARVQWNNRESGSVRAFEMYGEFAHVSYQEERQSDGATLFRYLSSAPDSPMALFTDINTRKPGGDGYDRVQVANLEMGQNAQLPEAHGARGRALSFIALCRPEGEGERMIELFDYDMGDVAPGARTNGVVIERGDIDSMKVIRSADNGEASIRVFYAVREQSQDGAEQFRLNRLDIKPVAKQGGQSGTARYDIDVAKTEYDMVLPTNSFDVNFFGGRPYLTWLASTAGESDGDPVVWRLWMAAYDETNNLFIDPAVFAEFEVPPIRYDKDRRAYDLDCAIENIVFTENGAGYFNAVASDLTRIENAADRPAIPPRALYTFRAQFKPAADIVMAIPKKLTLIAGDFADVCMGVLNEGNLPVSAFDVSLYEVTDGRIADKPLQTSHINVLDPEASYLSMQDGEAQMTGRKAAYRLEEYDLGSRRQDWIPKFKREIYKAVRHDDGAGVEVVSDTTTDRYTGYVQTDMLMPGSTASFNTTFMIPADWREQKTLRFMVTAVSVPRYWSDLVPNSAGGAAEMTYRFDRESGMLVLSDGLKANNAAGGGLYANRVETSETDMNADIHDLEITHRQYTGWDGQEWVDITIDNHAATGNEMKLTCAVYLDSADTPEYFSLPYNQRSISRQRAQTISLPVSTLVGDPSAHRSARVVIGAVDVTERAYANNEFYLWLDGTGEALTIRSQPTDTAVQEGEDVAFTVEVQGGRQPYKYQWQIWDAKRGVWVDLPGFTEPTLSRRDIEKKWDGCRFICVITDAEGQSVTTEPFTLTVRDKVPTGDRTNLPLYLAVALAALAAFLLLCRRARGSRR